MPLIPALDVLPLLRRVRPEPLQIGFQGGMYERAAKRPIPRRQHPCCDGFDGCNDLCSSSATKSRTGSTVGDSSSTTSPFPSVLPTSTGGTPSVSTTLSLPSSTSTADPFAASNTVVPQSTIQRSHAGAIAGGVVGGFVLVCLIVAAVIFRLRRRCIKNKTPPSAEFMPVTSRQPVMANVGSYNDNAPADTPPPFTRGSFSDPLFEKVTASARTQRVMGAADELA